MRSFFGRWIGGLFPLCASAVGCNPSLVREEPPVDCSVVDEYEFSPEATFFRSFELDQMGDPCPWFPATDGTGLVRCDPIDALVPSDISPLILNPDLLIPDAPIHTRDDVMASVRIEGGNTCEPSVLCASLANLLPSSLSNAEVRDAIRPLARDVGWVLCQPWVRCDSRWASVPEGLPQEEHSATLCEDVTVRRAEAAIACEPIPDGPRCGSQDALRLTARGNQDWGSLYGDYAFATNTTDASEYEGIALWARAAPSTGRSVQVLLNDKYTTNIALDDGSPDPSHESACVDEEIDENQVGSNPTPGVPIGGGSTPGVVPSEDACGNAYTKLLTVTERWELYLLPFDSFTQDPFPNRRLEGIDRESIRGMIIRAPKDIALDFWIDDLSFYRKRAD